MTEDYKAALERAKDLHARSSLATREDLEHIFPELKESEDERIRKEIRNFLIDMECKKEWITYLERQKENVEKAAHRNDRKALLGGGAERRRDAAHSRQVIQDGAQR